MKYLAFILLLVLSKPSFSQKSEFSFEFGEVEKEELELDSCEFYSGADAMVLFEVGDLWFDYNSTRGLFFVLKVNKRIKIFNKAGKKYASDKISYLISESNRFSDKIYDFSAFTFNLEDDKVIKTKLSKKDKFINTINKYVEELSFTMPNVKVGSVIDIEYTINSNSIGNLRTWYFQDIIPVKYNRLTYSIPENFVYNEVTLGNISIGNIKKHQDIQQLFSQATNMDVTEVVRRDILPYEMEPFISSLMSSLGRIEFNLIYYNPICFSTCSSTSTFSKDFGSSYEKINEKLLTSSLFGIRLSKGRFSRKWKDEFKGKKKLEIAEWILNKFQKELAWNKINSIYARTSGSSLFKKKIGSIGDINLNFIAALRYNDIEAFPVILKRRGSGIPHPVYPKIWSFNYVVALVKIDSVEYLCDASLNMPFGLIRKDAINYNGWLVDEKGRWVDLVKAANYKEAIMSEFDFNKDSIINRIKLKLYDYAAIEAFEKYENGKFEEKLKKELPDWEFVKVDFDNNNNRSCFQFELLLKREIEDENLILLKPFHLSVIKENPFKKEKRVANIDFNYKKELNLYTIINAPIGYDIETPSSIKFTTEGRKLIFKYVINNVGNKITALNKLVFNTAVFAPNEYTGLKQFFDEMVAANKQVIILKKIK